MLQEDKDYAISIGAIFLEENIFYIPNFFNKDLIAKIKKEIDEEVDWTFSENGNSFADTFIIKNPESLKEIDEIYNKFAEWPSFGKNFSNLTNFEFHNVKWVKRRGPGNIESGMGPHWDGDPSHKYVDPEEDGSLKMSNKNGTIQVPNNTKWGCVVYLNDNFNGGELFYNDLDITFKPVAGTLICHAAAPAKYKHSVLNADGQRYNLILNFMYGDVNEPEKGEQPVDFKNKRSSYEI